MKTFTMTLHKSAFSALCKIKLTVYERHGKFGKYEGWNFNSGNYLFTTDTK